MVRENAVRLSDTEHQRLKQYRDEAYDRFVPLGEVIGDLLDETDRDI